MNLEVKEFCNNNSTKLILSKLNHFQLTDIISIQQFLDERKKLCQQYQKQAFEILSGNDFLRQKFELFTTKINIEDKGVFFDLYEEFLMVS